MYSLQDYNYTLPDSLIAQTPADPPESCKLLIYDKSSEVIQDDIFSSLPDLIDPDTHIFFNNSKVLKARIPLSFDDWSGEVFYLKSIDKYRFEALVRPGKKFKIGSTLSFGDTSVEVEAMTEEGRILKSSKPILEVLEQYGNMPLPPYISYSQEKETPYQPVFASTPGSVAAPTASLHFTKPLINSLQDLGVRISYTTLHVGLGTFKPVNTENIKEYPIHAERIVVEPGIFSTLRYSKETKRPILAVGTTVTRTLESLPYLYVLLKNSDNVEANHYRNELTKEISLEEAQKIIGDIQLSGESISFDSRVYIYPGFAFKIIDQLITNFHLPKSSLLMLVAGLIGHEQLFKVYEHAIEQAYQFYSFGDAMWIR